MISDDLITATLREIEEPLITEKELSDETGISQQTISRIIRTRQMNQYKIFVNGKYHNAYDAAQVKKIIEAFGGRKSTRKKKLDIKKLL